jgi:protein gp37
MMGVKTSIEWCDSSVSPAPCCTGCELGAHCFARRMNGRFHGRNGFPETFDTPIYRPERMTAALRWSDLTGKKRPGKPWLDGRPRMIFLNDLGDAFAPFLRKERTGLCCIPAWCLDSQHWLTWWLSDIAKSPHVWIVLTKWPDRMKVWTQHVGPLPPNLWLGTSVTDQPTADARLPHLLGIDAAVRIVSYEPAIEPVDFTYRGLGINCPDCGGTGILDDDHPDHGRQTHEGDDDDDCLTCWHGGHEQIVHGIHWLIAGAETGPDSRPSHPDNFRSARDQCAAAGISYFFKSCGDWITKENSRPSDESFPPFTATHCWNPESQVGFSDRRDWAYRVGKKAAGRLLDGVEQNELPEVTR